MKTTWVRAFLLLAALLAPMGLSPEPVAAAGPVPYDPPIEATNFDGSRWVVVRDADVDEAATRDVAEELAAAGPFVYGEMISHNGIATSPCFNQPRENVPNWGVVSLDPDCVLTIRLDHDHPRTADASNSNNVAIAFDSDFFNRIRNSEGLYRNATDVEVARMGVGHEFFHSLQAGWNAWNPLWLSWLEGTGRFSTTALVPEVEAQADTFWYGTYKLNGVNDYVNRDTNSRPETFAVQGPTALDFCDDPFNTQQWIKRSAQGRPFSPHGARGYPLALFWGYLYSHNGLQSVIQTLINVQQSAGVATKEECNLKLPQYITQALQAVPGATHQTFQAVLRDFSVAVYTKEFSWGAANGGPAHDFGAHLPDVWRVALAAPPAGESVLHQYEMGAWSHMYLQLPGDLSYRVTPSGTPEAEWQFRLFVRDGENVVVQDLTNGAAVLVDATGHDEVILNVVHFDDEWGAFGVSLGPV